MLLNQCPFNIDHGLSQYFLIKLLTATSFLQKYQHFQFFFFLSFPTAAGLVAGLAKSLGCSYLYPLLSFKDRDISPSPLHISRCEYTAACTYPSDPCSALPTCSQLCAPAPLAPAALAASSREESGQWPLTTALAKAVLSSMAIKHTVQKSSLSSRLSHLQGNLEPSGISPARTRTSKVEVLPKLRLSRNSAIGDAGAQHLVWNSLGSVIQKPLALREAEQCQAVSQHCESQSALAFLLQLAGSSADPLLLIMPG